jgi:hypothetical protein
VLDAGVVLVALLVVEGVGAGSASSSSSSDNIQNMSPSELHKPISPARSGVRLHLHWLVKPAGLLYPLHVLCVYFECILLLGVPNYMHYRCDTRSNLGVRTSSGSRKLETKGRHSYCTTATATCREPQGASQHANWGSKARCSCPMDDKCRCGHRLTHKGDAQGWIT